MGDAAATTIQKLYRSHSAKKEISNYLWKHTWNQLDLDEEKDVSTSDDTQLEALLLQALKEKKPEEGLQIKVLKQKFVVDDHYNGPRVPNPITIETIIDMISYFKDGGLLHYKYAYWIITEANKILEKLPNIVEVSIPVNGRLTIVGDIHGQLADLLTIFRMNGLPSPANSYIFNGDFVDRGDMGIEVLLILYSLKILYPDLVHFNRGNHEQKRLNEKYGFAYEVRTKYDKEILDVCTNSWMNLPLCTLIEKKILVLHGGLFYTDGVKLAHIAGLRRKIDLPPGTAKEGGIKIMEDILWSDPIVGEGREKAKRGAGTNFGEDVTNEFLEGNGLMMLIRSHQMVDEGYELLHNKKVATVFSASNYCGTNGNRGAFAVLHSSKKEFFPVFYTYMAEPLSKSHFGMKDVSRDELLQSQTLQKLREKIYLNRHDLGYCFTQFDTDQDGKITKVEWSNGMSSVMHLSIPWLKLQPYLADCDEDGNINYTMFLERYQLYTQSVNGDGWQEAIIEKICMKIFAASGDLVQEFKKYDADGDGKVSYEEFMSGIQKYELGLTNDQIYGLMRSIDRDRNNTVDWNEFVARFTVVFTRVKDGKPRTQSLAEQPSVEREEWLIKAIEQIGFLIVKSRMSTLEAFKSFDSDRNGSLSYAEFGDALAVLGLWYPPHQITKIAQYVDTNHSNSISLDEFERAFRVVDSKSKGSGWEAVILQRILAVFYKNRVSLQLAFQSMDKDGSGKIDVEEFKTGLKALNVLMDQPLSDLQITELHRVIDKDGDGCIDYDEFLHSFQVVDYKHSSHATVLHKSALRTSSESLKFGGSPRKISTPDKDRPRSHSLPPLSASFVNQKKDELSTSPPLRASPEKDTRKNPFRRFFS